MASLKKVILLQRERKKDIYIIEKAFQNLNGLIFIN